MKSTLLTIITLMMLSVTTAAQMETVIIDTPQKAKQVAGIVNDPAGSAISGVKVEERSDNWKTVLRSTVTDESGRFFFASTKHKKVYHLEFARSGFNWLRITVRLDKKSPPSIVVSMPFGT